MTDLVVIDAPHFYAAMEVAGYRVVKAAPILRGFIGQDIRKVVYVANRKGWRVFRRYYGLKLAK